MPLNLTRRQTVAALAGTAASVSCFRVHARSAPISLAATLPPGYAKDGSVDYSAHLQKVLNDLNARGGGEVVLPRNTTILIGDVVTYSNISIVADDWTAVLKVRPGSHGITLKPAPNGMPSRNLAFRGFALRGQVGVAGFSEHSHLLNLNVFANVEVENLLLSGFQGDGIYCGVGAANSDAHNTGFTARRSTFDGVNRDNRNGLTFIDIDGALVDGCEFVRCTRTDMPGPIDMEPNDSALSVIRDVTIRDCRFHGNGGGVAEVAVYVRATAKRLPSGITVERCTSQGYVGRGSFFYFTTNRQPDEPSPFNLRGNVVTGGGRPYLIVGARGGTITGNTFSDCRQNAKLGTASLPVRDISQSDNSFLRCGSSTG
jgi:hypothetical protein